MFRRLTPPMPVAELFADPAYITLPTTAVGMLFRLTEHISGGLSVRRSRATTPAGASVGVAKAEVAG